MSVAGRNHWSSLKNPLARWYAQVPATTRDGLFTLADAIVAAGDETRVFAVRELPGPEPFVAGRGESYGGYLRRLLDAGERPALFPISGLADGRRTVETDVAFFTGDGAVEQVTVTDVRDLVIRLRPDAAIRHGKQLASSAAVTVCGLGDLDPDAAEQMIVLWIELSTDLWFPEVRGYGEAQVWSGPEDGDRYSNAALAAVHTPRFNRFLARFGKAVVAAGGHIELETPRDPYLGDLYDDHGIAVPAAPPTVVAPARRLDASWPAPEVAIRPQRAPWLPAAVPARNAWSVRSSPAAAWTATMDKPATAEALVAIAHRLIAAGERDGLFRRVEAAGDAAPGACASYAEFVTALWQRTGAVPFFRDLHVSQQRGVRGDFHAVTRLAYFDGDGQVVEDDLRLPDSVLAGGGSRLGAVDVVGQIRHYNHPRREQGPLALTVAVHADAFFAAVEPAVGHGPAGTLVDNRVLAARNGPRLNAFLGEVRAVFTAAGGSWDLLPFGHYPLHHPELVTRDGVVLPTEIGPPP